MELLCAADLHLGRQPSRVPPRLRERLAELGPAAAWRRLVGEAVARRVAAVLLAGDVLDDDLDFYEALSDLRAGVETLVAAGIAVVAVAGNHDVAALPRLARLVPGVRLLGAGGAWEAARIVAGDEALNVIGWSFPAASYDRSPLATLDLVDLDLGPGPTVGLLHADLDQPGRYAPVTGAELRAHPLAAWLLGHVHKPHPLADEPFGYLGSLTAADPGEEGARGAWSLKVSNGRLELAPVNLAPLRYERATVDLSGLTDIAELDEMVLAVVAATLQRCALETPDLAALGLRLELRGRSQLAAEAGRRLGGSDLLDAVHDVDGVACFVHTVAQLATPELDLGALALGSDPLALAARAVLDLRDPAALGRDELLADAAGWVHDVGGRNVYSRLEPLTLAPEELAELLEEVALEALELMITNRQAEGGGGVA